MMGRLVSRLMSRQVADQQAAGARRQHLAVCQKAKNVPEAETLSRRSMPEAITISSRYISNHLPPIE